MANFRNIHEGNQELITGATSASYARSSSFATTVPAVGVSGVVANATTAATASHMNAVNITVGTLSDNRLSTNVPLKNTSNIFSSTQYFTGSTTTSATLASRLASDSTEYRWAMFTDGKMEWGTGAAGRDTNLYRSAANTLKTDDSFVVSGSLTVDGGSSFNQQMVIHSPTTAAFVIGDGTTRFYIRNDTGGLNWGPGGSSYDTNLYRSSASLLRTDDTFEARSLRVSAFEVITSARVLQNVTANASIITAGTLDDARLSANVAVRNGTNEFRVFKQLFTNIPVADIATASAGAYGVYQGAALTNGSSSLINNYFFYRGTNAVYADTGSGYAFYTQGSYPHPVIEVLAAAHGQTNWASDSPFKDAYLYQQVKGPTVSNTPTPVRITNANSSWLFGVKSDGDFEVGHGLWLGGQMIVSESRQLQNVTINASEIDRGTLNDARLSTNVPLLNGDNTFSNVNVFTAPTVNNSNIRVAVAGDAGYRFKIIGTGDLQWGDGTSTTTTDTNLYRSAAGVLKTDSSLTVAGKLTVGGRLIIDTDKVLDTALSSNVPLANGNNVFTALNRFSGASAATTVITAQVGNPSVANYIINADGKMEWGAGGSSARDTNLYRSAADTLKTDDSFIVGGSMTIGNDPMFGSTNGTLQAAWNLASYNSDTSAVTGAFVIKTTIPYTGSISKMTRMRVTGWNYVDGNSVIDLTIGWYRNAGTATNAFSHTGWVSNGIYRPSMVRMAVSPEGFVSIIIDDVTTVHNYPKLHVSEVLMGYSGGVTANYLSGWVIGKVVDLTGYTLIHNVVEQVEFNADRIVSGTLGDARLSTNVPLKNAANVFSGGNTFTAAPSFNAGATFAQNVDFGDLRLDTNGNNGGGDVDLYWTSATGGTKTLALWGNTTGTNLNLHLLDGDLVVNNQSVITNSRVLQNVATSASIITAGTLDDARLSSNVPLKNAANVFTANQIVTGSVSSSLGFAGVGTALTALNATNLSSGTVNDGRLSTNVPLKNSANVFTANQVITGSVSSSLGFAGVGTALTSLNASNLASGTVNDGRLSTNVPLKNAANVFTTNQTISGSLLLNNTPLVNGTAVSLNGHSHTEFALRTPVASQLVPEYSLAGLDGGTNVTYGRAVNRTASTYAKSVSFEFKDRASIGMSGAASYAGLLTLAAYSDASAGATHGQLGFVGDLLQWRSAAWGTGSWSAWSTILHSGNYNDYAPTKTGTGASGTWGISITGNAAQASTLANFTVAPRDTADLNTKRTSGTYGIDGGNTNTPDTGYGSLIVAANSDTGLQLYGGYLIDDLWFRGWHSSGTSFTTWRRALHDGNYGDYTVPKTGGTFSGNVTISSGGLFLNRVGSATTGIRWYDPSFTSWQDYMAPAGAGQGASGTITAPAGSLVTSWARRSFIENTGGYGWTFESATSTSTTPAVKFEIRSSDGSFKSWGDGVIAGALTTNGSLVTSATQHTLTTPSGYIQIGPMNTSTAHIYTDRPSFYFNKGLLVNGEAVAVRNGSDLTVPGSFNAEWSVVLKQGNLHFRHTNHYIGPTNSFIGDGSGDPGDVMFLKNGGSAWGIRVGHVLASDAYADASLVPTNGIYSKGAITSGGDITAYSDARKKKNVETINKALSMVKALRGVRYERTDTGAKSVGVIAQEVREVLPEVVHEDANGEYSVAYGNIIGVLIEAVKELAALVEKE